MGRGIVGAVVLAAVVVVTPPPERVHVVGHAVVAGESGPVAVTNACVEQAYTLKNWRVTGTYTWLYNGTGAPGSVAANAVTAITNASVTVGTGRNRCALPALTGVYKYGGTTTAKPQVSAEATCTGNDGRSVTGWGRLPPRVLAYTCTYFKSSGAVLASDVLIDNAVYPFFTQLAPTCSGAYDLETTMAHERLHTAGLAHVDATTNPGQLMAPAITPCSTEKRLLGAGDHAGLRAQAALG